MDQAGARLGDPPWGWALGADVPASRLPAAWLRWLAPGRLACTPARPPGHGPQPCAAPTRPPNLSAAAGVGELIRLAVERGRAARPGIELGVCGEHGGDPQSAHFFHAAGLDYVSCSPLRVPIARLAAAQAALKAAGL